MNLINCSGCDAPLDPRYVRYLDSMGPYCDGCHDDTFEAIRAADADAREDGPRDYLD